MQPFVTEKRRNNVSFIIDRKYICKVRERIENTHTDKNGNGNTYLDFWNISESQFLGI